MGDAARRWAQQLAGWGIPDEIVAAAPSDPWELAPSDFSPARRRPSVAAGVAAEAALDPPGSVLDVGCGAGAASLTLPPQAVTTVTGVDQSADMADAFEAARVEAGFDGRSVIGDWSEVLPDLDPHDVVVAHHVVYNVPDLAGLVAAMTAVARRRVVIEMTERHPRDRLTPYFRALHDLDRPDGPTTDDLVAVVRELGIEPIVERAEGGGSLHRDSEDAVVASLGRQLCVGPDRAEEIRAVLRTQPADGRRQVAVVHWNGAADQGGTLVG